MIDYVTSDQGDIEVRDAGTYLIGWIVPDPNGFSWWPMREDGGDRGCEFWAADIDAVKARIKQYLADEAEKESGGEW